ncbi:hypothetical protein BCV70DRAFT_184824 [Testicularia cyperi]|uniref:Uncharacterized protein n=1 Tax=Testicularia cyperi TaxID=1882483 RepID=A0A317XZH5_9BASI|nr:hypothetical protein BCV70DRAFT_184824 [Testicularia cyperi]
MADTALDYGSADPVANAAMQQDETMADAGGSRFYALPTDQAIEAGAQRGPSPLTEQDQKGLDDTDLMGTAEPSEIPDPPPVEGGSDIRLDTLLIEGQPITQLSTSRLFAYVTHYGAQPLGLEWIDDQRCKIVFADERSARLGLEYLCPAPVDGSSEDVQPLPNLDLLVEYEPDSWHTEYITSLTNPRKAHRVPAKLYNAVERQAATTEREQALQAEQTISSLPDDVPEIYREMEEEERRTKRESREVRGLKKLRGALWIRHAVQDVDRKESRASTRSQWYKQHGYEAGREIVPKLLQVGEVKGGVELFPDYKPSDATSGDGRGRGPKDRQAAMAQLDSELDGHVAGREAVDEPERRPGEMMADAVGTRQNGDLFDRLKSRRGGRGSAEGRWGHDAYNQSDAERQQRSARDGRRAADRRSRGRTTLEEMDEELDQMQSSRQYERELSPGRQPYRDTGRVKMKGRGRMKAPGAASGWNDGGANCTSRLDRKGELFDRMAHQRLADRFS